MNRTEVRTYYRYRTGLLCLLNTICILTVSGLAILVADFDELDVDEGIGVLALNGLYTIFFVGLIFSVMYLIAGIVSLKSQSEGIFSFSRFVSAIMALLMGFSVVDSIYVIRNQEIVWTSERRGILGILLVVSILSVCIAVWIFLLAFRALRFYDRGKKEAKDVEGFTAEKIRFGSSAVSLFCAGILNAALAFLLLYFSNMIREYDRQFAEENHVFSILLTVFFVVGMIVLLDTLFVAIICAKGKMEKAALLNRFCRIENLIYVVVSIILGAVLLPQKFTQSDYPDKAYIIFGFVLAVFALLYLFSNRKHNPQEREKKA